MTENEKNTILEEIIIVQGNQESLFILPTRYNEIINDTLEFHYDSQTKTGNFIFEDRKTLPLEIKEERIEDYLNKKDDIMVMNPKDEITPYLIKISKF